MRGSPACPPAPPTGTVLAPAAPLPSIHHATCCAFPCRPLLFSKALLLLLLNMPLLMGKGLLLCILATADPAPRCPGPADPCFCPWVLCTCCHCIQSESMLRMAVAPSAVPAGQEVPAGRTRQSTDLTCPNLCSTDPTAGEEKKSRSTWGVLLHPHLLRLLCADIHAPII
jgi:hypothetical protein